MDYNRFLPIGLLSTRQTYQPSCEIPPKITLSKKVTQNLPQKKLDHFKNTILRNFDPKRFDYFLKLFFSNFLWAQIG